ncbi:Dvir\GJ16705-PA-like protein [Anopheles sinensis]|uniref:Dvir\GJ16705-PA-like protein n=1 Tax=Anopheles sinensis TaxID=74873 RepID=A0A084VCL8_ANOSI|nr:Dvir\GJ16705-PA-like protein [Anopheles sinensis]
MVDARIDEEKLILLVQERRHLWNIKNVDYKNKHMSSRAWKEIGAELNVHDAAEGQFEKLSKALDKTAEFDKCD